MRIVRPSAFFKKVRERLVPEGSFHVRMLLSSVAAIIAIAGLAAIFVYIAWHEHRMDGMRAHTLEIVRLGGKAKNNLANLENNHSGFLLTGEASYLATFDADRATLARHLGELQKLVGDDRRQQTRVWAVGRLFDEWLNQFALPKIEARRRGAAISAGKPLTADSLGQPLMNKALRELDTLQQDEQSSLYAHSEDRHWVDLSFQALVFAPKIQSATARMEKCERDFLLTGDARAISEYSSASGEFDALHAHLMVLLAEDPQRLAMLQQISNDLHRWQSTVATPEINAKKYGSDVAALALRDHGKETMESLRRSLGIFEQAEMEVYKSASQRAKLQRILKTVGLGTLCTFAIGILIASGLYSFNAYTRHLHKIETAEARTRAIIECSLDGIITMNHHGIVHSLNPAAEKMFGVASAMIVGQSISKLIPQRLFLHDLVQTGRGSIMAMGTRQGFYPFPIEISLSGTEVGGQRQFVALIRDVTERKRSEETLKHIGLGVSATTGEEFVRSLVLQLSKALETEFAFIVETVVRGDQTVCSLAIAEQGTIRRKANVDLANTACEEVLKKGFQAHTHGVRGKFPFDDILKGLNAESFVAMPLTDHSGRSVGLMGVIDRKPMEKVEIAESTLQIFAARAGAEIERKRFEEDLAAEKERLAVTLRSIGDGFITIDSEGRVLMMNAVAEKHTGWPSENALGQPLHQVFHILDERTRKPSQATLQRIIETGSITGAQSHSLLISREGGERVIETSASPIRDRQNRTNGVVLVFRDITEKQRMEEERRKAEKLESLGVAAGGIAHDFNNLLTAIMGNISLALLTMDPDDEMTPRLTAAKKASLRAQELAGQLLTFAKGGAPVKKTASIAQLIRDTVTFTLRGTNIRHEFQAPDNLWAAEIDAGQISQVIGNMAVNAEQAMPVGGTLRLSCENVEINGETTGEPASLQPGRYVKISVRDEGVGIAAEHVKKIFDPYFSTKPKGSGLGLATSYSIVNGHDGLITVDSAPGSGASFHIYLPASSRRVATEKKSSSAPAKGHGRILVMDDEEEIRALVNFTLTPLGYDITEAPDAATAIRLYTDSMQANRKFDAVIMDLTIPGGMGGAEAIKKLRVIDPDIKAIVSSGYASDPIMSRHHDYGFCGMIAKPYEASALGHTVNDVVNGVFEDVDPADAELAQAH